MKKKLTLITWNLMNKLEFDFSTCETFNALPLDHKRFILEYFKSYNITKAYKKIYKCTLKSAYANGARLIANDRIQVALKEVSAIILQGDVASAQELREFWTKIMRGSITDVCSWQDHSGLLFNKGSEEMDRDTTRLVKKVKVPKISTILLPEKAFIRSSKQE